MSGVLFLNLVVASKSHLASSFEISMIVNAYIFVIIIVVVVVVVVIVVVKNVYISVVVAAVAVVILPQDL